MKSEEYLETKSSMKCTSCGKQFKYDSERRRHEQSHTPQFECKVCKKKFSFVSALRRHEKQHERKGSVVCSECDRKFRDDTLLKRHMKYAHKGTFTCSKCEATFNSDTALHTHMKTHQPESERRYRCRADGCNKSFNFSHHLIHHELAHTDTKQHFCKICGKGFIQAHHLKTHLKSHDPVEWLPCTKSGCSKKFTTKYARKRHLATHKIMDSGISSDSNSACDISELEERASTCETKTKIISEELSSNTVPGDLLQIETDNMNKDLSLKSKSNDKSIDVDTIEDCIRSCKTVLGGCIMSGNEELNENCLCAQISSDVTEDYRMTPNDGHKNVKENEIKTDSEKDNIVKLVNTYDETVKSESNDFCEGCECRDLCNTNSVPLNLTNKCPKGRYSAEDGIFPEIVYKRDGTIKIKHTFDSDIVLDAKTVEVDNKVFPFNSCKSVLGKCIVSGNGTIGDGCLCAKMALADDYSVNAEEIDEITPHPRIV